MFISLCVVCIVLCGCVWERREVERRGVERVNGSKSPWAKKNKMQQQQHKTREIDIQ